LSKRDDLFIVLRHDAVPTKLRTTATVAWASGGRLGLKFKDVSAARRWFDDLLSSHPYLAASGRLPRNVAVTATIGRRGDPSIYGPLMREDARTLTPHERLVFDLVSAHTPVRAVALNARLPSDEFARALFGLMEKGVVVRDDDPAACDDAPALSCSVVLPDIVVP
jgi:hypothetical protein